MEALSKNSDCWRRKIDRFLYDGIVGFLLDNRGGFNGGTLSVPPLPHSAEPSGFTAVGSSSLLTFRPNADTILGELDVGFGQVFCED